VRLKVVGRYDPTNRLVRLARLVWTRGVVGDGKGYSAKLSIGLRPCWFMWRGEYDGWLLTVLGFRLHYVKAWGGIFC
jgi:hypothetical protein